jgi:hypothetical protein
MGHAYTAPKGSDEALVLGICSSEAEDLMESLMTLHSDKVPGRSREIAPPRRLASKR